MTLFNRKYVEPEMEENRFTHWTDDNGNILDIVKLKTGGDIYRSAYEKHLSAVNVANQQNETRWAFDKILGRKTTVADVLYDEADADNIKITAELSRKKEQEEKKKKELLDNPEKVGNELLSQWRLLTDKWNKLKSKAQWWLMDEDREDEYRKYLENEIITTKDTIQTLRNYLQKNEEEKRMLWEKLQTFEWHDIKRGEEKIEAINKQNGEFTKKIQELQIKFENLIIETQKEVFDEETLEQFQRDHNKKIKRPYVSDDPRNQETKPSDYGMFYLSDDEKKEAEIIYNTLVSFVKWINQVFQTGRFNRTEREVNKAQLLHIETSPQDVFIQKEKYVTKSPYGSRTEKDLLWFEDDFSYWDGSYSYSKKTTDDFLIYTYPNKEEADKAYATLALGRKIVNTLPRTFLKRSSCSCCGHRVIFWIPYRKRADIS